ncbi:Protoporphyrinogen oxidase [Mariprofundus aestuarium]|uniref:Protoporphyrinogen oxidase n=1 Tax=Mariprofundus aestuarium TaxID=1921086 RepID=A0A2K8L0J6_MARES|nr:FAD-dependent oxidoreductase [Mariprofundus aestuarium]ATX80797.1 Protoporphyrinogen oxidase [Mariprofundus aestuarium]
MSERYDLIVIGAGISGLAMAFEAKQAGMKVLVLEKEERAGGCFDSPTIEGDEPFWLEMGTHTCFNSYGRLLRILKKVGLMDRMGARQKLRYKMLADGKLVSIPSRLKFVELFANAWRIFSTTKDGKSVQEYYRAIVGPNNYANVFSHAFNAVLCQQADDVPAGMLFRKRPRDKNVMRSYTFPEGLNNIIAELEKRVECRKGQAIELVAYDENNGFSVTLADSSVHADQLVVATPVLAASRLLKGAFPELAEQLGWVNEVEIETVGIVVSKDDLPLEPVAGIIAADGDFYSSVSRDIVEHAQFRGMAFHFKPGLLDENQKIERICTLLQLQRHQLIQIYHKTNRLPSPDMGHHVLMHKVDELLAEKPLALIGNYFEGVAVEDCLARVESEFKRLSQIR